MAEHLSDIVNTMSIAANGDIIAFAYSKGGDGVVLWRPEDAPFDDRPYATNRVDGSGALYSGNYDMSWEQAVADFKARVDIRRK